MLPACRAIINPHPGRCFQLARQGPSKLVSQHRPPHQPHVRPPPSALRLHSRVAFQSHTYHPVRNGVDPVPILLALTVATGTSYLLADYFYPDPGPIATVPQTTVSDEPAPTPTANRSPVVAEIMAEAFGEDRPGNLTPEKEEKLRQLWLKLFELFGIVEPTLTRTDTQSTAGDSPKIDKKRKGSWFSLRSNKESPDPGAEGGFQAEDKFGLNKEFQKAIASQSKEELRANFWWMAKQDDPDALLLRFLRARKWVIQDALVMLIAAMRWRSNEMKVDEDIMSVGENGFLKMSKEGTGEKQKLGKDFMTQLHVGKSVLHGTDKAGRPITTVRVQLHQPGKEGEKSLEMYTVYKIETARFFLRHPVDTATIIFDMTNFGLKNMDYAPVKFIIKCFEANYPESLGSVLIYKAPWVFQGIWKIIKGWLDPVVASKIDFVGNVTELEQYIDRSQIPKELDGDESYVYTYSDPTPEIDERMKDTATRDAIKKERRGISDEYEKATTAWAKDGKAESQAERQRLKDALRDNYWKLDPYVRARSLYDRMGLIPEANGGSAPGANGVARDSKVNGGADGLAGQVGDLKLEQTSTANSFVSAHEGEAPKPVTAA